jgi:hypothetical protein
MARTERLIVPLTINEKKKVKQWAKEAKLNDSDYVRSKLSLPLARGKRNNYEKAPEPPRGDPENAVDVEELARAIFSGEDQRVVDPLVMTMAEARKEAKRRLELAVVER